MAQRPTRTRSLFQALLLPLFMVLTFEILVLMLAVPVGGLGDRISDNNQEIITFQTTRQKDFLESYMVNSWSDLSVLSGEISATVQSMLDSGEITLFGLDRDSECYNRILTAVSEDLVANLYARQVNGVYIILNTEDLDQVSVGALKPCLYIRDPDPSSAPSSLYSDLLLECAPLGVLNALPISTDSGWQPMLSFTDKYEQAYFYKTYQAAYRSVRADRVQRHYGYWTEAPYELQGSDRSSVSYSVPIVLNDGTVIGVLGVELLTNYISSLLPAGELLASDQSTYLLLRSGEDPSDLTVVLNSVGYYMDFTSGSDIRLHSLADGGYSLVNGEREYYAEVQELRLYRTDSPHADQRWYLAGIIKTDEIFSFSEDLNSILALALFLMLFVGITSIIIVSLRLSRPISLLTTKITDARRTNDYNPELPSTGIEEIDQLSDEFTALAHELLDTSTKFLRIMDMASVELAGYEWRDGQDSIYVTENFFPMLGLYDVNVDEMSVDTFREIVEALRSGPEVVVAPDGSRIYCVNQENGTRYVRAEASQDGDRHVGLLEDVTRSTMERIRVEHERDYDVLTGLYNRRAFYRKAAQVFSGTTAESCAAVIMMDLDNLKITNDRFGHDWGDKYLRQTAMCLMDYTPQSAVCSRISGDEFYVLLHNYPNRAALRADIDRLMAAIRESVMTLPSGEEMRLSVSAGVSWYPDDSTDLRELIKFADFAMYQAKGSRKGTMREFDAEAYGRDVYLIQGRSELNTLIEQEKVAYHFQTIYSAATAEVVAYEALMRVDFPTLKSPDVVLRLASTQGKLSHIERLTMFKATEAFQKLRETGKVQNNSLLFINSLSGQQLSEEDASLFHEKFGDLQPQIVMEITESEYLDADTLDAKRSQPGSSGLFALDDYGSGYNGEKNLLLLQPKFVKVDMVFIRGIDTNQDRQQLVSSLVTYAHGRNMQVVAEGIETGAELEKVLELGVDLLQGYFLSRPNAVPGAISRDAESIIHRFRQENADA